MGQFYEPLSIGTAKPEWKNHEIPHHLFDFVQVPRNFSVSEYRSVVQKLMKEIWERKALPVVVGGSMFYLRALLFSPYEAHQKDSHGNFINTPLEYDVKTSDELWDILFKIDPVRASMINKNDAYRINRALHIWHNSGMLPSLYKPQFQPIARFHITFVSRDREDLYQRIDQRVLAMFRQGWAEEVRALSAPWRTFLLQKKLLGYPEIIEMIDKGESPLENHKTEAIIQQKTRNYAKRQITFWRSLKESVQAQEGFCGMTEELNLTLSSVDLYLDHIQRVVDFQIKGLS